MYSTTYFANVAGANAKKENCFPIPNKLEEVQKYAAPVLVEFEKTSIYYEYFIFTLTIGFNKKPRTDRAKYQEVNTYR